MTRRWLDLDDDDEPDTEPLRRKHMKRRAKIILLLALLLPIAAEAGPGGCTNHATLTPFAFETITVSTTSIGFTAATLAPSGSNPAEMAIVSVESNPVRYRLDGLAPSSTVGHPAVAGDALTVCGTLSAKALRFIRSGAVDATLSVTYYRGGDQ